MRKQAFCLCENKDVDQLCSNCTADKRLCFRHVDSIVPLLPNFKLLAIFCSCTDRFVSDPDANLKDCFLTSRLI